MKKLILPVLFLALLTASVLQVNLVAKAPTETAATEPATAVEVAVTPKATPGEEPSATLAIALAMPETNDRERVAKFESLNYMLLYSKEKNEGTVSMLLQVEEEQLRVARSIELPPLRTEKILLIAWRYADKEQWDEYTALVDQLDPLFKEMALAYRQSFDDVKADRRNEAKERMLAFQPRIMAMRQSYASGIATIFCFTALGKLGFVDEVIEQCVQVRASWSLPGLASRFDPQSKEEDFWEERILDDSFRNAVLDVGAYLVTNDDLETALDYACKMYDMGKPYSCVTDPTRTIIDQIINKYIAKGEIDTAMQALDRIISVIGNSAQWVGHSIFLALLEKNEFDRALELTRKTDSLNSLVQNQMYFELMEDTLKRNDRKKCDELFDEAMEQADKLERPADRLRNMEFYARIAVQLNDSEKIDRVLNAAQKYRDAALTEKNPRAYNDVAAERSKVHTLCAYAMVLYRIGKTDEAKTALNDALRQADHVIDAERSEESLRQKDWSLNGIAATQVRLELPNDAFQTVTLIANKEVKTEAYDFLCSGFTQIKDFPNARKALALAKESLKEINNSRILGNIEFVEQRLNEAEKAAAAESVTTKVIVPPEKTPTNAKPPVAELDPETAKLVQLAESMVTLPNVTVERLRDVVNDLSRSAGKMSGGDKEREPVNRTLVKVYDKIIALKPDADVLGNTYWSKNFVLHDLIRVRYADEDIAALEKFAEETDNAENESIANVRKHAKSWAKRTKIWQLERRENPTIEQFLAVRKETVDFLKNNKTSDSYSAGTLVTLAEKFWANGLLTQDQMYETYLMAIDALENRENGEVKSELETRLAFHQLKGKTLQFTGTNINGQAFDWTAYKGKSVLMAFTSSWYGGREMQDVIRFHEEFGGKGLEVVTFVSLTKGHRSSTGEQDKTWLRMMVDRLKYPGTVLTDIRSSEVALQKISEFLGIRQYTFIGATFLFVGEDGKVISLADVDQTRKNLVENFGEPDQITAKRAIERSREYASVPKPCESNLREIMLAMHTYHDVHKKLPPAYTIDEKGNKLHSWRVLLLPYLEHTAIYEAIRLDEPWDSEYNKQFHNIIVPVFQCHKTAFGPNPQPVTDYAAIVGPQGAFEENGKTLWLGDFSDGTSNTLVFVERATPVNWMDPTDITFEEAVKGIGVSENGIADAHNGGCNCAFCDGSTRFLPKDIDPKLLRAILTRSGGESVSFPE